MSLSNEDKAGVYYRNNPILRGFVDALLCASIDDEGEPLDRNYGRGDIAPETLRRIGGFIADFLGGVAATYIDGRTPEHADGVWLGSEQGGYDLFLTAARHGAGFWDGDWGDDGDTLTELVRACGGDACESVYVGDGGLIYIEGWES